MSFIGHSSEMLSAEANQSYVKNFLLIRIVFILSSTAFRCFPLRSSCKLELNCKVNMNIK
jgi:hypothetical protein